jgi:peptidoglycan-associated lipoprotein
MSSVAGGPQGYVKVDKPTLNERPAKAKDHEEGAAAPTARRRKRMPNVMRLAWNARFAFALLAALTASACASKVNELGAAGAGGGAAVPGSQQDFVVNVGDRVFFDSDSTELTMQSRATLDKQAQWLTTYNRYAFTIEGHADERGTREYNIALGARRAQAVRDYLASRGIEPSRMRTISYGKERPVAVCDDISCWSQNRRAVTVINASS